MNRASWASRGELAAIYPLLGGTRLLSAAGAPAATTALPMLLYRLVGTADVLRVDGAGSLHRRRDTALRRLRLLAARTDLQARASRVAANRAGISGNAPQNRHRRGSLAR